MAHSQMQHPDGGIVDVYSQERADTLRKRGYTDVVKPAAEPSQGDAAKRGPGRPRKE